ncbi:NADH-quinone oxidoreductase subunit C [Intrasporangium calvum]|uniref:NADH-quinone oxidoreductase subunit C n=1 Tax=Intrasporangium calvum TaxID=53358 RepID=A0ABT5GI08_9MICO|nr:NADH-quinone oxidoreductase subunit C [Intrasporangium calvum]MDC5697734.1 NADH-quinone oxidoreductase subunit C [Intrasporangium calvum]
MRVSAVREVPFGEWSSTVLALRDEGYSFFDWLTAVDQTDSTPDTPTDGEAPADAAVAGYDIVCHLIRVGTPGSLESVLLRTRAPEGLPVPSVTGVFPGAAWHERETFEMFGIEFDGFTDRSGEGLRPLLLPDGFEGYPLRKSFVLTSRASKPWPGAKEPGEGHGGGAPSRRRVQAPGVPGPEWGPR